MDQTDPRTPLSPQEREQLADLPAFNRDLGRKGWTLRDRALEDHNLAGIHLIGGGLVGCDLLGCDLSGARLEHASIEDCNLAGSSLRNARFERVLFRACDLSTIDAKGASFLGCTFVSCTGVKPNFADATIHDGTLEDCTLSGARFKGGDIRRTTCSASRLSKCTWFQVVVVELTFRECELSDAVFSDLAGQTLTLEACKIASSGMDAGSFRAVEFKQCEVDGLTLEEIKLDGLRFIRCPAIASLKLVEADIKSLDIDQAERIVAPAIYESKLNALTIRGGEMVGALFEDSTIGDSTLAALTVEGLDLNLCRLSSVTFQDCRLGGPLRLNDSIFDRLSLKGVKADDTLTVEHANLTYRNADRFPGT